MKPKIFIFSNSPNGGEGGAYAMAEDGHVLGHHYCSSECYVKMDLDTDRPDRHLDYHKHYPDGYELEFVPARDVKTHIGLQAAYQKNQLLPK